ncbi:MAG: DUF6379 domain-containing protein [Steroidobacteraceae bacterium]
MENNFSHSLVSEAESRLLPGHIEVGVRIPWYRALPLSVVEVAELRVDGRPVPPEDMTWTLNGRTFPLSALPDLVGESWFVLDTAFIRVKTGADPAKAHEVGLQLNLYPPYIPGLTWVTRATRTLSPTPVSV